MIESPGRPAGAASERRVCVCILNWNGWRDTLACLESVLRSDHPAFQVVVVDNGSDDDSVERIQRWAEGELPTDPDPSHPLAALVEPPVAKPVAWAGYTADAIEHLPPGAAADVPLVLISSPRNQGFAAGMNLGLRYALRVGAFDYVWLLNNDTVVPPDSLSHLVAKLAREPQLGMCGSTLLFYDDPDCVQALGGFRYNVWLGIPTPIGQSLRFADAAPIDEAAIERTMYGIQGASVFARLEFVRQVGLLSEEYHLYFEEQDWAARARARGFRIGYAAQSIVYHKEGRSTGGNSQRREQRSATADFYQLRSRLLFTRRFYPYALPVVSVGLAGVALNRVRRGQRDRLPMIARLALWGLLGGRAAWIPRLEAAGPAAKHREGRTRGDA